MMFFLYVNIRFIKVWLLPVITFLLLFLVISSCKKEDNTPPEIVLAGKDTVIIQLNESWTDPGYIATDNKDGDITAKVVVTGTVITTQINLYTVTYSVIDNSGNQFDVKRYVFVTADSLQGSYHVNAEVSGTNAGTYSYNVNVLTVDEYNTLQIKNFCDLGTNVKLSLVFEGTQLSIPSQTLSGVNPDYEGNISGSGTYDGTNKKILHIQYTLNYLNGGSDNGSATFIRN